MNRWTFGLVVAVASVSLADAAHAQVFYSYGTPVPVYSPVFVVPQPVVTAYTYPSASVYVAPAPVAYMPQPIVQTTYSAPVVVPAPAYIVPSNRVVTRVHNGPINYSQTVRAYGPTAGPHYARVRVHQGLFGTTVTERIR